MTQDNSLEALLVVHFSDDVKTNNTIACKRCWGRVARASSRMSRAPPPSGAFRQGAKRTARSPCQDSGFQRVRLRHDLSFEGWNSQAHREFPGNLVSSNLRWDNLSREIGSTPSGDPTCVSITCHAFNEHRSPSSMCHAFNCLRRVSIIAQCCIVCSMFWWRV